MAARHPLIVDYATRDPYRKALQLMQRESAALATTDDLVAEARRLDEAGGAISAYWHPKVTINEYGRTVEYLAKRPDAAEREPLRLDTHFDFTGQQEARDALGRIIDWGANERLVLTPKIVQKIVKVGPEWFAGTMENPFFEVGRPRQDLAIPMTVELMLGTRTVGAHKATATYIASGDLGHTVIIDVGGGLIVTVTLPRDVSAETNIEFTFEPAGHTGRAARRAVGFFDHLNEADEIILRFPRGVLHLGDRDGDDLEVGATLRELIHDLAIIEQRCDVDFAIPQLLPYGAHRIWIRVARMILEGKHVAIPTAPNAWVRLAGTLDDHLEQLLTSQARFRQRLPSFEVELLGERVNLGTADFFCMVEVEDSDEVIASLHAGTANGRVVPLKPSAGYPLTAYAAGESTEDVPPPGLSEWGIPGYQEHPNFAGGTFDWSDVGEDDEPA